MIGAAADIPFTRCITGRSRSSIPNSPPEISSVARPATRSIARVNERRTLSLVVWMAKYQLDVWRGFAVRQIVVDLKETV